MKYYNKQLKQIIYEKRRATSTFWDKQWMQRIVEESISEIVPKSSLIHKITKRYLTPEDGVILEGGCGLGDQVRILNANGYSCIGVDFAKETVDLLKRKLPQIDIRYGDVRNLEFENGYFSGYWSIGVIEHFQTGYIDIAKEMERVVNPGGYLFLSFPFMNGLRIMKSKFNCYERMKEGEVKGFYQFALNKNQVIKNFSKLQFELIGIHYYSSLEGIADEVSFLRNFINIWIKNRNKHVLLKILVRLISSILDLCFGFMIGHSVILIFKKI